MVEFEAYAADCRLSGRVDLGDRRLTDALNATYELCLQAARLESLEDGHVVEIPEVTVGRDELCLVVASGTRGDAARRLHTHTTPVEVDLGPYHVAGAVHGTPASDPLGAVAWRAPWVPLTEVVLTYRQGTELVREEIATLLVNRGLAGSFRAVEEASVALPWETPRTSMPARVRSIDLTGTLRDDLAPDDRAGGVPTSQEPPV
jgi:hypothetical protein